MSLAASFLIALLACIVSIYFFTSRGTIVSRHSPAVRLFRVEQKQLKDMEEDIEGDTYKKFTFERRQTSTRKAREIFGDEAEDMVNVRYHIMEGWQVSLAGLIRLSGLEKMLCPVC